MKLVASAFFCVALVAPAQVAESANSGYKTPEGRARVVQRLDAADRDSSQKPQELVRAMDLKP
ncbi:MAG: hypothetical protein ACREMQ_07040, partial [Longimicrobiales bacterium]